MKDKKGFTLVEIIIVLALIGIILLMIYSPISFSVKNFANENEKTSAISDARAAMDYLTREIRKSDLVEVIDNTIIMDSVVYKVENEGLYEDDMRVMEGIHDLIADKNGEKISIEITIRDSKDKDYKLSSIINIR